jgi:hypothetical protein
MHHTVLHKCGIGKNAAQQTGEQQQAVNTAAYDTTYNGFSDFQSG